MLIKGKLNTYKVRWEQCGWSYAVAVVWERRKIPFLPFSRWKRVFESDGISYCKAEKMHREPMVAWFMNTVSKYELYALSWRDAPINE